MGKMIKVLFEFFLRSGAQILLSKRDITFLNIYSKYLFWQKMKNDFKFFTAVMVKQYQKNHKRQRHLYQIAH